VQRQYGKEILGAGNCCFAALVDLVVQKLDQFYSELVKAPPSSLMLSSEFRYAA
jgi:hypothetical protein